MCAYSMVVDHARQNWGTPWLPNPYTPQVSPGQYITAEQWAEYLRLKAAAEAQDAADDAPDCVKPDALEWEQRMEAYLKKVGVL